MAKNKNILRKTLLNYGNKLFITLFGTFKNTDFLISVNNFQLRECSLFIPGVGTEEKLILKSKNMPPNLLADNFFLTQPSHGLDFFNTISFLFTKTTTSQSNRNLERIRKLEAVLTNYEEGLIPKGNYNIMIKRYIWKYLQT